MSPFILEEGWFLLYSVLLGIGIAFVYDCLRIGRRVIAHGIFWISLEDLLYWFFVACSFFYLLYRENNGAVRWFAIMGAAAGMLLFKRTLSPVWVRYGSLLLCGVRRMLSRICGLLMKPFRSAGRLMGKAAGRLNRRLRRAARILKKRLTIDCRMTKISLYGYCRGKQRGKKNDKA